MTFCLRSTFCVAFLSMLGLVLTRNIGQNVSPDEDEIITDETLRLLLGKLGQLLDPSYIFSNYYTASNNVYGYLQLNFSDIHVDGINDLEVVKAHVIQNPLTMEMGVKFRSIGSRGRYYLYLDDSLLKLKGFGNYGLNCSNVSIYLNVSLATNSKNTLVVDHIISDYDVPHIQVNFDNLGEDKDVSVFINDFLNRFIPLSLVEMKPTLRNILEEKVSAVANFAVANMTISEFKNFINSLVN